ncbi:MAG: hypothetical protein Kow0037_15340 [Calditrichia bacterium]
MEMKKKILVALYLLLCIILFQIIKHTVLLVHPIGRFQTKLSVEDVGKKSRQLLNFLGIPLDGKLKVSAVFPAGRIPEEDSLTALDKYYWKATNFLKAGNLQAVSVSSESGNTRAELESHILELRFNPRGELIYFLPGTLGENEEPLSRGRPLHSNAIGAARIFLAYLGYDTTAITLIGQNIQTDSLSRNHQYRFSAGSHPASELIVEVSNNRIIHFQRKISAADTKNADSIWETVLVVWGILVHLILLAGLLYYLITLLRKEAISFKLAIPLGVMILIAQGVNTLGELLPLARAMWWIFVGGVLVSAVGFGIGAIFLVAVAEGVGRQVWPSRLLTMDLLLRKRQFSSKVSFSILQGYTLGLLAAFFYLLILKWFHFHLNIPLKMEITYMVSQYWWVSLGLLFSSVLITAIFGEYFYRLFALSWLRQYTSRFLILVIAGILVGANIKLNMQPEPVGAKVMLMMLTSAFFVVWFLKTDLLTALAGVMVFRIMPEAAALASSVIEPAQTAGNVANILLAIIAFISAWVYLMQKPEAEKDYFRPSYLEKMEEKERLTRELEIARHVQEQFLPTRLPEIPGYRFAASCIPAWEVGGDYFDFFDLSDGRLGVVIADVSNKGVSAAFFMSMLKGFLKASIQNIAVPAEILSNLNELFFREVDKKYFVTAVLGILNPQTGTFTFARAGHQEILLVKGDSGKLEKYAPAGIGIGLMEPGEFRKRTENLTITFAPGDLLVLYTDGYVECINDRNEMLGESKFYAAIQNNSKETVENILHKLETEFKSWIKSRNAHDDRTIILIKRN